MASTLNVGSGLSVGKSVTVTSTLHTNGGGELKKYGTTGAELTAGAELINVNAGPGNGRLPECIAEIQVLLQDWPIQLLK